MTAQYMPVVLDLLEGARDPDFDKLTVSSMFQESVNEGTAIYELQPDQRTVKITPVADSGLIRIHYNVDDGHYHPVRGTATVEVGHVPQVIDVSTSTGMNAPCPITLNGSDPDGDALTFHVGDAPLFGSLTGTPPNLTYHPAPGFFGMDLFNYVVSDGHFTSTAHVRITVLRPNHAPTVTPQSITVQKNTEVAITLTGSDVDSDWLTFTAMTFPAHGALLGSGAKLVYKPAAGYVGPDSFTFAALDIRDLSEPATISIDVVEELPTDVGANALQ